MTCPASVTIAGVEYRCDFRHGNKWGLWHHHSGHESGAIVQPLARWRQDVPPPEREWQPGDVVLDASASRLLALRRGSEESDAVKFPWLANGGWYRDADLVRPLTRLVPEVTP